MNEERNEDGITVEFVTTMQITNEDGKLGLRPRFAARIFPLPKGRSRKPIIALVGATWREAAEQVGMWFEHGRPTIDEARALNDADPDLSTQRISQ